MGKIKYWIATKILGLKVLQREDIDEIIWHNERLINKWYTKYKNASPSRNSANITSKRLVELKHNVNDILQEYKEVMFTKKDR